ALQDELNRNILDSLLEFTRKCSSTRDHSDWASQMRASEIPTAALVLGIGRKTVLSILSHSRYIKRLPLMFIFGIATSPSTIQHMLPNSVSSLLCIELFQSLSCTQHLTAVIDKLILTSSFPFKLSGKVMQVLVSIFLYHDFSVRNFIKGLQMLLEMNESRRSKRMSPFEILRNEAVEFVDSLVKNHLSPPESKPLYEVCYYTSSATVRRHLNATPRTSIQAALSSPYSYIQVCSLGVLIGSYVKNDSLKTEDGTVSNAAPDICIAYKLHLECGRLINLYDWLEVSLQLNHDELSACDLFRSKHVFGGTDINGLIIFPLAPNTNSTFRLCIAIVLRRSVLLIRLSGY
ncbi:hypothetical protein GOODEAATRI_012891, partial [Goodea atripinnis]